MTWQQWVLVAFFVITCALSMSKEATKAKAITVLLTAALVWVTLSIPTGG